MNTGKPELGFSMAQNRVKFKTTGLPIRHLLFALLPLLLTLSVLELGTRLFHLDRPAKSSLALTPEAQKLFVPSMQLFWKMRSNAKIQFKDYFVSTNEKGLRGPDIVSKKQNEIRILCLGDSNVFGYGVEYEETFAAKLPALLSACSKHFNFTGINAGVNSYSTFQCAQFLETKGVELEPDIVLVYSMINDFVIRHSGSTLFGSPKTDPELYRSPGQKVYRFMMEISAFFRFLSYHYAGHKTGNTAQKKPFTPDQEGWVYRMTEKERLEALFRMHDICREKGILLILIRPVYLILERNPDDALVRFSHKFRVPLIDAGMALTPDGMAGDHFFLDAVHPTPEGHTRLATLISSWICKNILRNAGQN